jgi:hypothetical protein
MVIKRLLVSAHLKFKNVKIETSGHKTTILSVLYGCETWSLTLRKEHRSKVSQNLVSRRVQDVVGIK